MNKSKLHQELVSESTTWGTIYEVGEMSGIDIFFLILIILFTLIYFLGLKSSETAREFLKLMCVLLMAFVLKSRYDTFILSQTLDNDSDVLFLEGKLTTAKSVLTFEPAIGERVQIANFDFFRPRPMHSPSGCWKDSFSDPFRFSLGEELRIHYIWLEEQGPTALVDGQSKALDIPCILKVEKRVQVLR